MEDIVKFCEEMQESSPVLYENLMNEKSVFHDKTISLLEERFLKRIPKKKRIDKTIRKIFELSNGDTSHFKVIEKKLVDYKINQVKRRIKNKTIASFNEKKMILEIKKSVTSMNYFYVLCCLAAIIIGAFYLDKAVLSLISAIAGGAINSLLTERNSI